MLTFTAVERLARALATDLPSSAIVGIDGWTGVGKSTLSQSLSSSLNGSCYDLDTALDRNRISYVPSLRLDEIGEALASRSGLLLVSGICLREVLTRVGFAAHAHIYVKRMASWGWADEDELGGGLMPTLGSSGGEAVRREMRAYHKLWRPHELADFEFQRLG